MIENNICGNMLESVRGTMVLSIAALLEKGAT